MKIDLELKNKVLNFIKTANKYCTSEEILKGLDISGSRVYLSYRGIDVTELNRECGFIRRPKSNRLLSKTPSLDKDSLVCKITSIIKSENRYVHRSELHSKFKVWSDWITYYDLDIHGINKSLGYYKDSPMSKLNKKDLIDSIRSYIISKSRYVSQQEIVETFKVSLAFLTQSSIDTLELNRECGFGNGYSYFELKVLNVLLKYYDNVVVQKTFEDCRSEKGYLLRFDFYVEGLLIEADGSQHWDSSHRFYNEDLVKRDNLKEVYAKSKGISLIRIPFKSRFENTDDYIENYLLESLKSLVTTAGLEITNVKVRKALGLDNQQPNS